MSADRPLELESFVGTVPAMLYRSRLVPEPYLIEFVTDEMTSIAGYPATEFMGPEPKRRWLELVHPGDIDRMRSTLRDVPADGAINEVEYRVRRSDGSHAWILSRFRKLSLEDGSVWVHGAALDVTARHEAEDLRLRLESERARADALQQSRARIVEAGDEARRRLERDLHDGAQQRLLVSLLTLRRGAKAADTTPAAPILAEAVGHLEQGLAELRELARGIHPSQLSEQGLAEAVGRLAERASLPVEVEVPEERLPPPVEIAFYFTVSEALTNVARYAGATRARVSVTVQDGLATAEIADDGRGGANTAGGSGLRGLADRLEALGGSLELESLPGCGTVVRAHAPLAVPAGRRLATRRSEATRRPREVRMSDYAVASLEEIEEIDDGRCPFRAVRHQFGITSFGVNAFIGRAAGDRIINEHDEAGENEELYLVHSGRARFELDGESVDAPAGTLVFARPGVKRTAFAEEPATTLIAVGGTPGEAYEPSGYELWAPVRPLYEAGDYAAVADRLNATIADHPYPFVFYNLACVESLAGRKDDAIAHLARAIELSDRFRGFAEGDSDLDAIRDEPGFQRLFET